MHDKPDSQEICFIPDDDYLSFVRSRRLGRDTSGPIVDEAGNPVGEHSGIEAFTIGQRKGLGIAFGEPRYVVGIEALTRTVTIGPRASLDKAGLEASKFNWQTDPPEGPVRGLAQIRAQHRPVPALAEPLPGNRARVWFNHPQSAVTPGQVVALYDGDLLIGGGWIDRALDADNGHANAGGS